MRKLSIRVLLLTGLSVLSSVAIAASSIGNWNVYYGHLHNHTTVSDGSGSPDQAYSYARDVAGLDFFSTGDHAESTSSSEYDLIKSTANAYNEDGVFAAFYAFEWSSSTHGHVLVVNSDDYCTSSSSATNTFSELLTWLSGRETIAFFNHPGRESNAFEHYDGTVSDKFVGMELWNKTSGFNTYYYNDGFHSNDGGMGHYDEALLRGWKVGASGAEDNHGTTWGTQVPWRKAILADNLTRTDLYAAMKARRFFSTLDKNIGLLIEMDSQPMGSTVLGGTNTIVIQANDADNEIFDRVELLKNGVVINTWYPNSSTPYITEVVNSSDGDYYYARVRQADGDEAISSPIWISGGSSNTFPVADAGNDQSVTDSDTSGSELVTLDGSASYDPDGSIVSYDWKEGSTTIATGANPTVDLAVGVHTIDLTVTDNDGATATDTVVVTVNSGYTGPACFSDTNENHGVAGRAYKSRGRYYAHGSTDLLGKTGDVTTLLESSTGYWEMVSNCQ